MIFSEDVAVFKLYMSYSELQGSHDGCCQGKRVAADKQNNWIWSRSDRRYHVVV